MMYEAQRKIRRIGRVDDVRFSIRVELEFMKKKKYIESNVKVESFDFQVEWKKWNLI